MNTIKNDLNPLAAGQQYYSRVNANFPWGQPLPVYYRESQGLQQPFAQSRSVQSSSAFSTCARPGEDWTQIPNLAERRRIQNRIAQRKYRQKSKHELDQLSRLAQSGNPQDVHKWEVAKAKANGTRKASIRKARSSASPTSSQSSTPPLPVASVVTDFSYLAGDGAPASYSSINNRGTMYSAVNTFPQVSLSEYSVGIPSLSDFDGNLSAPFSGSFGMGQRASFTPIY